MEHKLNIELLDTEILKLQKMINDAKEIYDYYSKSLTALKSIKSTIDIPYNSTFTTELLYKILEIYKIDIEEVFIKNREYRYANYKIALTNFLFSFNCSKSAIARALNIDHSTVDRNIKIHQERLLYHVEYKELFSNLVENQSEVLQYLEDKYYYQKNTNKAVKKAIKNELDIELKELINKNLPY